MTTTEERNFPPEPSAWFFRWKWSWVAAITSATLTLKPIRGKIIDRRTNVYQHRDRLYGKPEIYFSQYHLLIDVFSPLNSKQLKRTFVFSCNIYPAQQIEWAAVEIKSISWKWLISVRLANVLDIWNHKIARVKFRRFVKWFENSFFI